MEQSPSSSAHFQWAGRRSLRGMLVCEFRWPCPIAPALGQRPVGFSRLQGGRPRIRVLEIRLFRSRHSRFAPLNEAPMKSAVIAITLLRFAPSKPVAFHFRSDGSASLQHWPPGRRHHLWFPHECVSEIGVLTASRRGARPPASAPDQAGVVEIESRKSTKLNAAFFRLMPLK